MVGRGDADGDSMKRPTSATEPRLQKNATSGNRQQEYLGAHVSTAGGPPTAPGRGRAIGATAIQIFTKTPNMWREPVITAEIATAFGRARDEHELVAIVSHDSYLINLASPDQALREKSTVAFQGELSRSEALGLNAIVSHPGNFLDDRDAGLERNAAGITESLRKVPGQVKLLMEVTAGTGTALGRSFEELRTLRDLVGEDVRDRVGFCADTCHLYSAGYDLVNDYDGVWETWDRILGLELLGCIHLNDSKTPFASHRDRHELIGEGSLGVEPFRRLMNDSRFASIPKVLETPKGDDETTNDRRMLDLLRSLVS
jgi:deoxyribonuclease-4